MRVDCDAVDGNEAINHIAVHLALMLRGDPIKLAVDGVVIAPAPHSHFKESDIDRNARKVDAMFCLCQSAVCVRLDLSTKSPHWKALYFRKTDTSLIVMLDIQQQYSSRREATQAFDALELTEPKHFTVPWLLSHCVGNVITFGGSPDNNAEVQELNDMFRFITRGSRLLDAHAAAALRISNEVHQFGVVNQLYPTVNHHAFLSLADLVGYEERHGSFGQKLQSSL